MTTASRENTSRRSVLPFLAALVAVLATLLSGATARAATTATAETCVRASAASVDVLVEPPQSVSAGERLGNELAQVIQAVATGVAAKGLANEVPAYAGGKTAGTLVGPGGTENALISGWHPPAAAMPKGTPGMNIVTKSHVEAHAAAIMRNEGLTEATLWINRAPCGGVTGCSAMLPRMVPSGSTLTINVVPNGSSGSIAETLIIRGVG